MSGAGGDRAAAAALGSKTGGLADMHPACFGMVMATGIVSIAAHLIGASGEAGALGASGAMDPRGEGWTILRWSALILAGANVLFYVALWALTAARVLRHRDRVAADLMHHGRSVGFFTTVAATCVLGSQVCVIGGSLWPAEGWPRAAAAASDAAWALWCFGVLLWAATTYGIFTILTVKAAKPSLAEGINGGWLLAVVAAQSVCVLGAQLAPGAWPNAKAPLLFFCLAMWLGGGMLYVWIISLIFYRYTFFVLSPSDLAPPYWINMGAVAISTLAGATLVAQAEHSPVLLELLPFVRGLTVAFWATATWWIPMLAILGFWRHVYRRFPLRYDVLYWGAVFPLGMYTVCTFRLSQAIDAPWLEAIARVFVWIALAAWLAEFGGLVWGRAMRLRHGA